jgi:hypothetical protein
MKAKRVINAAKVFKPYTFTISVETEEEHTTLKSISYANVRIPEALFSEGHGFPPSKGSSEACHEFLHLLGEVIRE